MPARCARDVIDATRVSAAPDLDASWSRRSRCLEDRLTHRASVARSTSLFTAVAACGAHIIILFFYLYFILIFYFLFILFYIIFLNFFFYIFIFLFFKFLFFFLLFYYIFFSFFSFLYCFITSKFTLHPIPSYLNSLNCITISSNLLTIHHILHKTFSLQQSILLYLHFLPTLYKSQNCHSTQQSPLPNQYPHLIPTSPSRYPSTHFIILHTTIIFIFLLTTFLLISCTL